MANTLVLLSQMELELQTNEERVRREEAQRRRVALEEQRAELAKQVSGHLHNHYALLISFHASVASSSR